MSASVVSSTSSAQLSSLLRLNPIASQKAKNEIEKRRADIKTYTIPIIFDGDDDRKAFLRSHHKKQTSSKRAAMYRMEMLKKYPMTVGKFYHDLVEHSGRVTSEHFWMRYDYRCCDLTRVLKEMKLVKQASKKSFKNEPKKGMAVSKTPKKEGTKSAHMSWMTIKSLTSSKNKIEASSIPGIEAAATVDTTDEDVATDHIEQFKQSVGTAKVVDATPAESAKESAEQAISNSSTVFRGKECNENDVLQRMITPAIFIGVWVLTVLVASILQSPSSWMSQKFGNQLCSPIRPGAIFDAEALGKKRDNLVLTAPWWAPARMKDGLFDYLCATDAMGQSRKKTMVSIDIGTKGFFQGQDARSLFATVKEVGKEGNGNTLIRVRSVQSISSDTAGTKLIANGLKGGEKQFCSPWAL